MKFVLFDSRSANNQRTSGWERFTRELNIRIIGNHGNFTVVGNEASTQSWLDRIKSDLKSELKNDKFDLVHFPTYPPIIKNMNIDKALFHLHDLTWWKYPETASMGGKYYYKYFADRYIKYGGNITTGSQTVKQEIQDFFNISSSRVEIISPGVNECACLAQEKENQKPYILSVGTLEPRKNLETLVQAYLMSGIKNEIDLKIVGRKGWLKTSKTQIRLIENVNDVELHKLYTNCLAVFQPSLYEGFGLPIIEAARHGKPVICSDIPIFHEVLGAAGIYVKPMDIDSWIDAMKEVIQLEYISDELIEISKKYSWSNSAQQALKIYKTRLS